jgi:CBS domain-containing protein
VILCKDVMTLDPICCVANSNALLAASLMQEQDIGPIPVVEDPESKKLIGIITDRDLVIKVIAEGLDPETTLVADVMTRDPVRCLPDESIDEALDRMSRYQIRRIPVVNDNNEIVGIISQADVATRMADLEKVGEVVQEISEQ